VASLGRELERNLGQRLARYAREPAALDRSPEPRFLADEVAELIDRYNGLHFRLAEGRLAEVQALERLPVEAWHRWLDLWEARWQREEPQ
jgi:hypothetical protein